MKKGLFMLAAFLGTFGIGLYWFNGLIDKRVDEAHAAGKAECEAEYAKEQVKVTEKREEVQNVQRRKMVIVWARPNSRLPALIERMRERGIGTADHHSEEGNLSGRRK